jgi:hypothetical protein
MRTRLSVFLSPILCAVALGALPACQDDGQMAVQGVNPRTGHVAGDQTVEIHGKNFRTDIGYTVYFGKARAKSVIIRNPETLLVSSPSGEVGPVDVTVRADDGNGFVMRSAYSYQEMGGNVVAKIGAAPSAAQDKKGNLAY